MKERKKERKKEKGNITIAHKSLSHNAGRLATMCSKDLEGSRYQITTEQEL